MGRKSAVISLALLATVLAGQATAAECKPNLIGDFPVTMSGASPLVHGVIAGQEVSFIIDSGAFMSLLSADAVAKFNVKTYATGMRAIGVGGGFDVRSARLEDFVLGGFRVKSSEFLVSDTLPSRGGVVGLFGQDFLTQFDIEYDLANGRIRFFKPEGCQKFAMAYWSTSPSVADIVPIGNSNGQTTTTVSVNDAKVRAVLDTGATASVLSLEAAARAGVTPTSPGVVPVSDLRGLGGEVDAWLAPVASFAIGTEAVKNTRLRIGDLRSGIRAETETGSRTRLRESRPWEMLIGADFFLAHRIFVSYSQNRLYFTYNGGGIFRPIPNAGLQVAAENQGAAGISADAGALSRRAAASLARRDYVSAIADFDRIVQLEPTVAQHRYDRARAHRASGKPALAKADLDETLRLKPDHAEALMERASLTLRQDQTRAAADYDAAIALAPDNQAFLRRRAAAYIDASLFKEAVGYLDTLTARWPKGGEAQEAINMRCWARGLWGQELDKALADCNAVLKAQPDNAAYLDSRGMVWLRLGDFKRAIADYDKALKDEPTMTWSLYGRGLAKTRLGDLAGGKADMDAATARSAFVADMAKQAGLTP